MRLYLRFSRFLAASLALGACARATAAQVVVEVAPAGIPIRTTLLTSADFARNFSFQMSQVAPTAMLPARLHAAPQAQILAGISANQAVATQDEESHSGLERYADALRNVPAAPLAGDEPSFSRLFDGLPSGADSAATPIDATSAGTSGPALQPSENRRSGFLSFWDRLAKVAGFTPLTLSEAKANVEAARDRYRRELKSIQGLEGIRASGGKAYQIRDALTESLRNLNRQQMRLSKFRNYYSPTPLQDEYIGESIGVEWTNEFREMGVGIHYIMDPEELAQYRVVVNESGKLQKANGQLLNGAAIFVMDQAGNAYARTDFGHALSDGKYVRHSSFLRGEAVAAAGQVYVENGKLIKLNRRSGHYKPSERANKQFLDMLAKNGADVSTVQIESGYQ